MGRFLHAALAVLFALWQVGAWADARQDVVERLRGVQTDKLRLPSAAATYDAVVDTLARRLFALLAREQPGWGPEHPLWSRLYPQFRADFDEAMSRVVADYDWRTAFAPERLLMRAMSGMSPAQAEDAALLLETPAHATAVLGTLAAAPTVFAAMSAQTAPGLYSAAERQALMQKAGAVFAESDPALQTLRDRLLRGLTDAGELTQRLDSPVLRVELDALALRWRGRLSGN